MIIDTCRVKGSNIGNLDFDKLILSEKGRRRRLTCGNLWLSASGT